MIATTISGGTEYSCCARCQRRGIFAPEFDAFGDPRIGQKDLAVFGPRLHLFGRARNRVEDVLFAFGVFEQLGQLVAAEALLLRRV